VVPDEAPWLIDSHAHLQLPEFDADREAVLVRAREAGVRAIVNIGIDLPTSRTSLEIARREPDVFTSLGVHPNTSGDTDLAADLAQIEALAADPKVVAIGEIGLDYYRHRATPERQRESCLRQLQLADRLDLPVVIHCRDAHAEMLPLLSDWVREAVCRTGRRGVIHCFSGSPAQAQAYIELGYYVSLPGTVTFKNAVEAAAVAREIPLDRLLLETDAPFLTPNPYRGRRNEPAYVKLVAARIALIRGDSLESVSAACAANTIELFGLPLKVGEDGTE
jgi:TatD DNase family protein